MKRVLTALVLIPIILAIVLRAPLWLFTLVLALFAILAAYEYLELGKGYQIKANLGVSIFWLVLLFLPIARYIEAPNAVGTWLILCAPLFLLEVLVLLVAGLAREDLRTALPSAAFSAFSFPYIGFTLGALLLIRAVAGPFYVLYTLIVTWAGDTFAYYVGRAIGRHKLAPRVSPGKSWEGTVASVISATLVGAALLYYKIQIVTWMTSVNIIHAQSVLGIPHMAEFDWRWAILAGVTINIAAQLGDLVESMLKRGADVKDSGNILPGHGGILDRIDALLFAAPVACYYALSRLI
jgi:phosphatidate cytidylyltransferase